MTRSVLVVLAVVLLAVVLVVGSPWRSQPNRAAAESDAATADLEHAPSVARLISARPQDAPSPTVEPATTTLATEVLRDSPEEDPRAVIEGIDPLLREQNVIMRAPDPKRTGSGFVELESRFRTETADASWSLGMQARILDQVAQVNGLRLVSLEADCRATICRVKLYHPAGTNALSSLDELVPMATAIGFSHVVQGATVGEHEVPISVLYLQRGQDPTPR